MAGERKGRPVLTVIGGVALVVACTVGAAAAGHLVTSKQIKNHTIQGVDVRNGTLGVNTWTQGARAKLASAAEQTQALVYEQDISSAVWTKVGSPADGYSRLKVAAPTVLTEEVLVDYAPLVYVYTSDFGGWGQVPYYTERGILVTAEIRVGSITLIRSQDGGQSTQSWHNAIRLVLVPRSEALPLS